MLNPVRGDLQEETNSKLGILDVKRKTVRSLEKIKGCLRHLLKAKERPSSVHHQDRSRFVLSQFLGHISTECMSTKTGLLFHNNASLRLIQSLIEVEY